MKSLLVSLGGDVPDELRSWVRQGSTSVEIATGPDAAHSVDQSIERIVVWSNRDGSMPRGIDALEPKRVFYVSPARGHAPSGLARDQVFVWPDDKDRLRTVLTVRKVTLKAR
jgi:hypothetical protein